MLFTSHLLCRFQTAQPQPRRIAWMMAGVLLGMGFGTLDLPLWADGPADNQVDQVRRIPKLGIDVPADVREELTQKLTELAQSIAEIRNLTLRAPSPFDDDRNGRGAPLPTPLLLELLPDVEVFHRAVDQALRYQEFFDPKEFDAARKALDLGQQRAQEMLAGQPSWTTKTGLVVRGYRSKLDNTVQPYGVVIPEDFTGFLHAAQPIGLVQPFDTASAPYANSSAGSPHSGSGQRAVRCDLWFHGRGETLSELNFITQRLTNPGEFQPADTIVIHPYGRYCNANKLAGEIDTLEVLEHAFRTYRIDPERIAVRGFSMGGAACWQFAVHYPGSWFAANPGAGFAETPDFLKVFQNETLEPTWWEQKLWRWYDCTGYAANLAFLPTIAYSGDMDKQKQAADIMAAAMQAEGITLQHVIGPMTGHKFHPDSRILIEQQLSVWDRLRSPHLLAAVLPLEGDWQTFDQFVTFTLRYPQSRCLRLEGLQEHWEPARVVAQQSIRAPDHWRLKTSNVTRFSAKPQLGQPAPKWLEIDGQAVSIRPDAPASQGLSPWLYFELIDDQWVHQVVATRQGLQKQPGLQGPIDDAFLDAFLFVKPTGSAATPELQRWIDAEFEHAVTHWRQQMRGDVRVRTDAEITREELQQYHLVLWGDPSSNSILKALHPRLPIHWQGNQLSVGDTAFEAAHHLPLMIYPNPLNPGKYVVLNSSFTYREYDYLNNARQTPKLPDWAIVDVRTPANSRWPGKIVAADFFDERWQLKPPRP
jgi:pimeloyl-ACP methyl ester carboxylesterase